VPRVSAPLDDRASTVEPLPPLRGWLALAVLFVINMGNYLDRYLVIGLQSKIKAEFTVDDAWIGLLTSSFIIVYMLASPLGGYLSDRFQRRIVIAGAIVLWSLATALASRSTNFPMLLVTRAAVGIGEAGYMAAGSALLADAFPANRRGSVMAIFNCAIPVGSASGYMLAGWLSNKSGWDWRSTCLWVGLPGIAFAPVAFVALRAPQAAAESSGSGWRETLRVYALLLRDRIYTTNLLGMAMMTFALGGLASWAVPWLEHRHSMKHEAADFATGAIVAGAGFLGTGLGAVVAAVLGKRGEVTSYAAVTGIGYVAAVPLIAYALLLGPEQRDLAMVLIFLSMIGAFLGTGPSNAIVPVRAPAAHRAAAFALLVFAIHLLGDAFSPPLMGKVADIVRAGHVQDPLELREALAYTSALWLTPIAFALAAVAMFACAAFARRDEKRL
jgi:MFS family permease